MQKSEIKAKLDATWTKFYELEDKANEARLQHGKESTEYAKAQTEWAEARRRRDELDAQFAKLSRKGSK